MSWQEDLRRIDGELADGKLTKEQYAVKREELLAQAATTDTPGTKTAAVPVKAPPVPAKDLLTTDRQTTAPSPADERSTDSMPHPKLTQQTARMGAQEGIRPSELPPPVPKAAHAPSKAQPRRTEQSSVAPPPDDQRRGAVSTWLFLGLGLLLAVALITGGVWWLSSGNEGNGGSGAPAVSGTPEPEPEPTSPPELVDRLPELPGVVNRNSGTFSPDEGAARKLYGADEAQLLKESKVSEVTWKGSSRRLGEASMAYVILVAKNDNARDADATAKTLRKLSQSRVPRTTGVRGFEKLPAFKKVTKDSNIYRVIYTSGDYTVRVGVIQSPGVDEKRVVSELSDLLAQVTAELPADEK